MEDQNNDCTCKEPISAFAFNTGRALEAFMNTYNNGLTNEHQLLWAKILDFYQKNKDSDDFDAGPRIMREFMKTFNIKEETEGHV